MTDPKEPTTDPTPTPAAPPADPPKEPDTITMPRAEFNRRSETARKQVFSDLGIESADDVKSMRDRLTELEQAEAKRKQEAMSEIERAQAQAAENERRATEAEAKAEAAARRAEEAERRANLERAMASRGIRDTEYAFYRLGSVTDEEEALKVIDGLLEDERESYKLGVTGEPPKPTPKPAATTQTPEPTPTPGKTEDGEYNAFNDPKFRENMAKRHGFHG